MAEKTIETILRNPHLPSLPTVAIQVLHLTRCPEVNMQEIARVIENDQALAVKVIRTVNSSYYALSKPCTTIRQAIVYLGLNAVKTLVLGFSLVECVDGQSDDRIGFDYVDYWRRTLYSASAAREIAAITGNLDPEEVFLAAMVHDIGMIALYRTYSDQYLQVIDMAAGEHGRLPALERQSFKTDHAEVGAAVAEHWKMPRQLVACIRYHHAVAAGPPELRQLLRTLELAQKAAVLAWAGDRNAQRDEFFHKAHESFGCNHEQTQRLIDVTIARALELAKLFKLDAGDVGESTVSDMMAEAVSQQVQHQAKILRDQELLRLQDDDSETDGPLVDPMTKLPGAGSFWTTMRRSYEQAVKSDCPLSMIFCRLTSVPSGCRERNSKPDRSTLRLQSEEPSDEEQHGRLVAAARFLEQRAGAQCIVHRYDHDRFALIIPGADKREAAGLAKQLYAELATKLRSNENAGADGSSDDAATILSFGATTLEPATQKIITSPELLVGFADKALQAAERARKNRVKVHIPTASETRAA